MPSEQALKLILTDDEVENSIVDLKTFLWENTNHGRRFERPMQPPPPPVVNQDRTL